jgi:hypothetical protein
MYIDLKAFSDGLLELSAGYQREAWRRERSNDSAGRYFIEMAKAELVIDIVRLLEHVAAGSPVEEVPYVMTEHSECE